MIDEVIVQCDEYTVYGIPFPCPRKMLVDGQRTKVIAFEFFSSLSGMDSRLNSFKVF
jgi:hypothetical protein